MTPQSPDPSLPTSSTQLIRDPSSTGPHKRALNIEEDGSSTGLQDTTPPPRTHSRINTEWSDMSTSSTVTLNPYSTGLTRDHYMTLDSMVNLSIDPAGPDDPIIQFWEHSVDRISTKLESHINKLKNPKYLKAPELKRQNLLQILHTRDSQLSIPLPLRERFHGLEMLGDGILYYSFCHLLMPRYPFPPTSLIGSVRDKLVSNSQLLHWAIAYRLPFSKELAEKGGNKVISDIFEEYVGALSEDDQGLARVYDWCSEILDYVVVSSITKDVLELNMSLQNMTASTTLKESVRDLYNMLEPLTRENIGKL